MTTPNPLWYQDHEEQKIVHIKLLEEDSESEESSESEEEKTFIRAF